jgi:hypothetical protein
MRLAARRPVPLVGGDGVALETFLASEPATLLGLDEHTFAR